MGISFIRDTATGGIFACLFRSFSFSKRFPVLIDCMILLPSILLSLASQ